MGRRSRVADLLPGNDIWFPVGFFQLGTKKKRKMRKIGFKAVSLDPASLKGEQGCARSRIELGSEVRDPGGARDRSFAVQGEQGSARPQAKLSHLWGTGCSASNRLKLLGQRPEFPETRPTYCVYVT